MRRRDGNNLLEEILEVLTEVLRPVALTDLHSEALQLRDISSQPSQAPPPAASQSDQQRMPLGLMQDAVDAADMQNCIPGDGRMDVTTCSVRDRGWG
jgi:hypothetical protein